MADNYQPREDVLHWRQLWVNKARTKKIVLQLKKSGFLNFYGSELKDGRWVNSHPFVYLNEYTANWLRDNIAALLGLLNQFKGGNHEAIKANMKKLESPDLSAPSIEPAADDTDALLQQLEEEPF